MTLGYGKRGKTKKLQEKKTKKKLKKLLRRKPNIGKSVGAGIPFYRLPPLIVWLFVLIHSQEHIHRINSHSVLMNMIINDVMDSIIRSKTA